ncbi:MAG: hypothetical protein ISQ34_04905 [Rickettsiales bacterium]|nr:hypothetical protein [Rickettsiales bacterium]
MIEKITKSIFGKKERKSAALSKLPQRIVDEGFIPYVCHYDPHTILTKDGELLQIVRITGFGDSNSASEIDSLRDKIRESIGEKAKKTNVAFWFTTLRRKKNITPPGKFEEGLAKRFNNAWAKKNDLRNQYVNELYVTFIIEGLDTSITNVASALKSFSFGATKKMHKNYLHKSHEELGGIVDNFLRDIEQYGAKKLGVIDWEGVLYSEPMRFFGKIINLHEERYPLVMNDISTDLSSHIVAFGERVLEVVGHHNKNYAAVLSLKEYSEVSTEHLDHILQLPFEFIITQSFDFCVNEKELNQYKHNDYILKVSKDEELRDITGLSSMTSEEKDNFETDYTKSQTSAMLIASSKEELEKDLEETLIHFHDLGLVVVREDIFMEHCFWSQLPANFSFLRRQKVVETDLIGGFAALHSYPCGSMAGNHWGSSVAVLNTVINTHYYFNFHLYNSGHTLILGPHNSGKTVLTNFLLAQAQRFNPKLLVVDTTGKSECFVKCLDGKYYDFYLKNNKLPLNPIKDIGDTNKLSDFVKSLLVGSNIDKEEIEHIIAICETIISSNITSLEESITKFDTPTTPSIYQELSKWVSDEKLKNTFTKEDSFDISHKIIGLNLVDIYDEKVIFRSVMCDLLNKIENSLNDEPFIVVFDNIFKALTSGIMAKKFEKFLELAAKKNCVVIIKCDDATTILKCKTHQNIHKNLANIIYMPDEDLDRECMEAINANEEEFKIIKMMGQGKQPNFLLKHGDDSIIFDFDLNPLTEYIDIFSNSELTLTILNNFIKEASVTDKEKKQDVMVSQLLPKFIEELKNVEKQRIADYEKQLKKERDEQRRIIREKMGGADD